MKRGFDYEQQVRNHLAIQPDVDQAWLWGKIPEKELENAGIIWNYDQQRIKRKKLWDLNENNIRDTGTDIVIKTKADTFELVQAKNYNDRKVYISDLSGFFFHCLVYDKNGFVYSNSAFSPQIINEYPPGFNRIKFIRFEYIEPTTLEIITSERNLSLRDYQKSAIDRLQRHFSTVNRAILSFCCGLGKTVVAAHVASEYDILIVFSPYRIHAEQNIRRFSDILPGRTQQIIHTDGSRDIDIIMQKISDRMIISATYASADVIVNLLPVLRSSSILIVIDEFHNISRADMTDSEKPMNILLSSSQRILFLSATVFGIMTIFEILAKTYKTICFCIRIPMAPTKYTIESLQKFAENKNGHCLSSNFTSSLDKYKWKCHLGHVWEASWANIQDKKSRSGSWCKKCLMTSIEEVKKCVEARQGTLLSTSMRTIGHKIKVKCEQGHIWEPRATSVLHENKWCPECNVNIREQTCKAIFEFILDKPFQKSKPEWLRSSRGILLELDGYNEELQLAFEHNGIQHYEEIPHLHYNADRLETQQQNDNTKLSLCKAFGIHLVVIPYRVPYKELVQYILNEIPLNLIPDPMPIIDNISHLTLNLNKSNDKLKDIQTFLDRKRPGATVISEKYIQHQEPLSFKCAQGHVFERSWHSVEMGSFCSLCNFDRLDPTEKIIMFCKKMQLDLKDKYVRSKDKLTWQCIACDVVFSKSWNEMRVFKGCSCQRANNSLPSLITK